MHVGRLLAARTGGAAVRAFESSARALNWRRRPWASAAATGATSSTSSAAAGGEEEEEEDHRDTLRATLRDLPGPVASALADELLLCGALSASVDEFRPPGAAEQKLFGARGRDGSDEEQGTESGGGGSYPSSPSSSSDSAAVFWDRCTLTAIFDRGADVPAALRRASLLAGLDPSSAGALLQPGAAELSEARASEWLDCLRGAFSPVFVEGKGEGGAGGRGLWILPEGCSLPQSPPPQEGGNASASASASSSSSSSSPPPVVVRLTPGLAFGTGDHPTTKMCLRWLAQEEVTRALCARGGRGGGVGGGGEGEREREREQREGGASLLDFGTGSGVLAAAAIALGCRSAVGTDVDPLALTAAAENAALNAAADAEEEEGDGAAAPSPPAPAPPPPPPPLLRTVLVSPDPPPRAGTTPDDDGDDDDESKDDPVGPPGSFDVVVANILQGPLLSLAPSLARYARPGAPVAVSGVLASQARAVAAAFAAAGVDLEEFDRERCGDGGGGGGGRGGEGEEGWWVCLSGRKRL